MAKVKSDKIVALTIIIIATIALVFIVTFTALIHGSSSEETQYKGIQHRTEINVDEQKYEVSRSPSDIDYEFLADAKQTFYTGE